MDVEAVAEGCDTTEGTAEQETAEVRCRKSLPTRPLPRIRVLGQLMPLMLPGHGLHLDGGQRCRLPGCRRLLREVGRQRHLHLPRARCAGHSQREPVPDWRRGE